MNSGSREGEHLALTLELQSFYTLLKTSSILRHISMLAHTIPHHQKFLDLLYSNYLLCHSILPTRSMDISWILLWILFTQCMFWDLFKTPSNPPFFPKLQVSSYPTPISSLIILTIYQCCPNCCFSISLYILLFLSSIYFCTLFFLAWKKRGSIFQLVQYHVSMKPSEFFHSQDFLFFMKEHMKKPICSFM